MARSKRLELVITGDAKQAQKALGDLERSAGRSGKKTEKSLFGVKDAFAGLAVAGVGMFALNEFDEAQKVAAQTEAVIKSTGGAANVTADEIGDLAGELSKKAAIDDDLIQSGANVLATFTAIKNEAGEGNDIFNQATEAALDLSVAFGKDLTSANTMLGKALQDPIKGVTALTKVGVSFSQQQKDQIRTLVESNDVLGAQKIILAELETQVGGSAEAQATALGRTKVAMGELAETAGSVLAPAIGAVADVAGVAATAFDSLDGWQQTAVLGAGGAAAGYAKWGDSLSDAAGKAQELWSSLDASATAGNLTRPKAAIEGIKGALTQSVGAAGKFRSGMIGAAAGVTAFVGTLEVLESLVDFEGDITHLEADLTDLGKGVIEPGEALSEFGGGIEDLASKFRKAANDSLGKRLGQSLFEIGEVKQAKSDINALDDALAGMVEGGNLEGARAAFGELSAELIDQGVPAEQIAMLMGDYFDAVDRARRGADGASGAVGPLTDELDDQESSAKSVWEQLDTLAGKYQRVADKAENAEQKVSDFYDEQFGRLTGAIEAEQSLRDLEAALGENGTALDITSEKGAENKQAMIEATTAYAEYAASLRQTEGPQAAVNAMEAYRLKLIDSLTQAGFTEAQVAALIEEMGLTPTDIHTVFGSNSGTEKVVVQGYVDVVKDTPSFWNTVFTADVSNALAQLELLGAALTPLGSSVLSGSAGRAADVYLDGKVQTGPPRALGGPVSPGVIYPINERGLEGFMPSVPGTVIPNRQMQSLAGGGGSVNVTVNVAGSVLTERDLVEAVIDGINRDTRAAGGRSPTQGTVRFADFR